jgi:thiol-disulfide isomerase/thioredoxin
VPEAEVALFYERNKELFDGAALKDVKVSIEGYLRGERQQAAVNAHIRSMGQRLEILVDRAWAKAQLPLARDNPVDQARWSGKGPTVVAFGAAGCCGPDVTKPLVEELAERLKDTKVQVVYVDAREQEILAGRYGVESVPTFVVFDGSGKETDRRSGLQEPDEIIKLVAPPPASRPSGKGRE